MRLHTKLTEGLVRDALRKVKAEGLVAGTVHFDECREHGSRQRPGAFEVRLGAFDKVPGDKRRKANTGQYGASVDYTATYDEWGFFIAEIFERDSEAVFGQYNGRDDFHNQTHGAYVR